MKPSSLPRAALALCLSFCLCLPTMTVVAGGKNGKKNFKEGVKHENTEQWDLAAQQYALAVADEPDNAEYRLRLVRAMQMASLMFAARGDLLAARVTIARQIATMSCAALEQGPMLSSPLRSKSRQ